MIDLHSHILCRMDDGPDSVEESIAMAVLYENAGFSKVVATPHYVRGTVWAPSKEAIGRRVAALNKSLAEKGIGIRIFSGMEIALDSDLGALLDAGTLCTLAESPYLLIEPPFHLLPRNWEQILFALAAKGYRVILAHPERCPPLVLDPENVDKIKDADIYFQANTGSFLGHYGEDVAAAAFDLLKQGCIHLLATDSHDTHNRHPGSMTETLPLLEAFAGAEAVDLLTRTNPQKVINGMPIEAPEPVRTDAGGRKKWLFF